MCKQGRDGAAFMAAGIREHPEVSGVPSSKQNLSGKVLPLVPGHEQRKRSALCSVIYQFRRKKRLLPYLCLTRSTLGQ